ncbi:MAG: 6-phosphogluconolactonase [Cyclobacteriaceae bacterium]
MIKHIYATQEEVARAVAYELITEAGKNEKLYIALSGGSTPKVLFRLLATEYHDKADWNNIHFFWGDDRCVAPDHVDSNYGMTKRLFFDKVNYPEANIHRVQGELNPEDANDAYANDIESLVPVKEGLPRFDMTILGMGEDGHTASIFPDSLKLLSDDIITAVASHPKTGQKRITLSGKVINNSRRTIFLVTGEGKAEKVKEISQGTGAGYPAAYIKSVSGPAEWFMDTQAAAKIK